MARAEWILQDNFKYVRNLKRVHWWRALANFTVFETLSRIIGSRGISVPSVDFKSLGSVSPIFIDLLRKLFRLRSQMRKAGYGRDEIAKITYIWALRVKSKIGRTEKYYSGQLAADLRRRLNANYQIQHRITAHWFNRALLARAKSAGSVVPTRTLKLEREWVDIPEILQ